MHFSSVAVWASAILSTRANTPEMVDSTEDVDFLSQLHACPAPCLTSSPSDWTFYPSFERLSLCKEPMLFDFAIGSLINNTNHIPVAVRACTESKTGSIESRNTVKAARDDFAASSCSPSRLSTTKRVLLRDGIGSTTKVDTRQVKDASNLLETYFSGTAEDCVNNIMLSYHKGDIVGVYQGDAVNKDSAAKMVQEILELRTSSKGSSTILSQVCDERGSDRILGVVTATDDIAYVQDALITWNHGKCVEAGQTRSSVDSDYQIMETPLLGQSDEDDDDNETRHDARSATEAVFNELVTREAKYCTKRKVGTGDTCPKLATACGVSTADFYKFNGGSDAFCNKLQIGSYVCCSSGFLKPQPYDNGTCYTYPIKSGDDCYTIGLANSLNNTEIESFNNKTTWGWSGCSPLVIGLNMCLSKGNPPAPAPLPNALCGPQMPGTKITGSVTNAESLATLNPCPLSACCNIWGQCGIDRDFCTVSKGPSGNPGTSAPGTFGCISNCGTSIVNNQQAPSSGYQRVGYYEAFNWERDCLHMRAEWSNTLNYTHMHWAFANVGEDLSIYINDTLGQWAGFKSLRNVKRIASFGGWGFSTEPATYSILRKAMTPEYRTTFVNNLVSFVQKTGIDGIDIDWEYPGATDIPGIPPAPKSDGPNYLATLKALRTALPAKYSLSIAAPASYWYLRSFPIKDMAAILDYIVFMAYDLHGQWDYGVPSAQPGCPTGNCLRSHVNQTEVMLALAMITKAGVNSNKIMVGESSYGRSFNMATVGCSGPQCLFTGDRTTSHATKGRCTNTGGYLADAEIKEIIARSSASSIKRWKDADTASDYLVYNDRQWVAYMAADTKEQRRTKWKGLNFLGTIDWAVDLQDFNAAEKVGPSGGYDDSGCINVFDNMIWDWANPVIDAPAGCTNILQPSPLPSPVTLTAYTTVTLVSAGTFRTSVVTAPFTVTEVSYQPFTVAKSDVSSGTVLTYNPVPRVTPRPVSITVPAGWTLTSGVGQGPPEATSIIGVPGNTQTQTTTTKSGGAVAVLTWLPTVSYVIPSQVGPKPIAPTKIPEDDRQPPEIPDPGVVDCKGSGCTVGPDCNGAGCKRGGDCIGPQCTKGGKCTGVNCVRGGGCFGENCTEGGECSGGACVEGGGCSGSKCTKGGGCSGASCVKGGGCVASATKSCSSGGCSGSPRCIGGGGCVGAWCTNPITLRVPTITGPTPPKPTCLVGCPSLPVCPPDQPRCNEPCNVARCPPGRMPTAKGCTTLATADLCTEFVSSTAVKTSPTTSYATTTRTQCEKFADCEAQARTVTTTITSDSATDPLATMSPFYDDFTDKAMAKSRFDAIASEYDAWLKSESKTTTSTSTKPSLTSTKPTTTTSKPPPPPPPTPSADCAFWDKGWGWRFEIYNIKDWATDGGDKLKDEEEGCGALTGWNWEEEEGHYPKVWFNLPFFIKEGCVERAIVSAGGPKIECDPSGWGRMAPLPVSSPTPTKGKESTPVSEPRPSPDVLTEEEEGEAERFYGDLDPGAASEPHHYEPMEW